MGQRLAAAIGALRLLERLIRPWRLLPGPASTLPVAVILNRFLTDDLVFILGILVSFWFALAHPDRVKTASSRGRACPSRPGLADRGGDIAAVARQASMDRDVAGPEPPKNGLARLHICTSQQARGSGAHDAAPSDSARPHAQRS